MCYILWMCVCSLSYLACKEHEPYYIVICGLSGCTVFFSRYLTKGPIFGKCYWTQKCVLILCTNLSETFLIIRRTKRDIINVRRCSCEVPVISCHFLIRIEFSRKIFEKYTNIKFRRNPSNGSRCVPRGWTDRHDEANSRFSKFS